MSTRSRRVIGAGRDFRRHHTVVPMGSRGVSPGLEAAAKSATHGHLPTTARFRERNGSHQTRDTANWGHSRRGASSSR